MKPATHVALCVVSCLVLGCSDSGDGGSNPTTTNCQRCYAEWKVAIVSDKDVPFFTNPTGVLVTTQSRELMGAPAPDSQAAVALISSAGELSALLPFTGSRLSAVEDDGSFFEMTSVDRIDFYDLNRQDNYIGVAKMGPNGQTAWTYETGGPEPDRIDTPDLRQKLIHRGDRLTLLATPSTSPMIDGQPVPLNGGVLEETISSSGQLLSRKVRNDLPYSGGTVVDDRNGGYVFADEDGTTVFHRGPDDTQSWAASAPSVFDFRSDRNGGGFALASVPGSNFAGSVNVVDGFPRREGPSSYLTHIDNSGAITAIELSDLVRSTLGVAQSVVATCGFRYGAEVGIVELWSFDLDKIGEFSWPGDCNQIEGVPGEDAFYIKGVANGSFGDIEAGENGTFLGKLRLASGQ